MILAEVSWGTPHWILPATVAVLMLLGLLVWSYATVTPRPGIRWLAFACKLLAIALLAFCLLEPLSNRVRPIPGANVFAILVDDSQSMQIDRGDLLRASEVPSWLDPRENSWVARLAQEFDLRLYRFGNRLETIEPASPLTFGASASNLTGALATLSERYRTRPLAGVLLLSDGNTTDSPIDNRGLAEPGFPVFPIVRREPDLPRDVLLKQVTTSQTNFETAPITIDAQILSQGFVGQSLAIRLLTLNGEIVEQREFPAPADRQPVNQRFRFRPAEPGVSFYQVQVFVKGESQLFSQGLSRTEATLVNNTRTILVDRGGGPYRILYLGGRPNWEFKFLRRALEADDEIELIGLLRIAAKEPRFVFQDRTGTGSTNRLFEGFDDLDPEDAESFDQPVLVRIGVKDETELRDGFPVTAEQLFAYHAIIVDDLEAGFFSPDQQLLMRRFVGQRGGGFLMFGGLSTFAHGGYDRTPLADLLPVYTESAAPPPASELFRWQLTREGRLESWTRLRLTEDAERQRLQQMPEFRIYSSSGEAKPGATVMASAVTNEDRSLPALVTQRFGNGRSAALLFGDLWRWSMRRETEQPEDLPVFWRQTIRWLVSNVPQRVEMQFHRNDESPALSRIEVRVRNGDFEPDDNATARLTITTPRGEAVPLSATASETEPGLYTTDYWCTDSGAYRATVQVTAADGSQLATRPNGWTSQPAEREFQELPTNRDFLRRLAESSGGDLVEPDSLDSFVASLPNRPNVVSESFIDPLWNHPWVFLLAMMLLCLEWGLRRWKGLA